MRAVRPVLAAGVAGLLALACGTFGDGKPCPCEMTIETAEINAGPRARGASPKRGAGIADLFDDCSCSRELSDKGARVLPVFQSELEADCKELASVNTGFLEPTKFETARTMLRNAAAELGANTVLIERFEPGEASGRAMACPDEYVAQRLKPQEAGGDASASLRNLENQIVDRDRGLIWQKCSYGQTDLGSVCQGQPLPFVWDSAISYCRGLGLAGRSWRLPTAEELAGLVDLNRQPTQPKINPELFPNTRKNVYWSSSLFEQRENVIRVVDFENGRMYGYALNNPGYVRCVADFSAR